MKLKLAVLVTGLLTAVSCGADDSIQAPEAGREQIAAALKDAVRLGYPGAQAVIGDGGHTWRVSAGAGDESTGAPFAEDARVRIGSNTKTFVATVLLQLVAEGRMELDAPVERYLPGMVHGPGIDGNRITIRNLLQHTSGLPEYVAEFGATPKPWQLDFVSEQVRWQTTDLVAVLRTTLTAPAVFEPGTKWEYSNTNYALAGLAIERVTGYSIAVEITRRILEPLDLHDTYYPAPDETEMRGPHPVGYSEVHGRRIDYTSQNVSAAGPAGAMVATGADLNRFFTALLDGKLLPPAQLAEMKNVRAVGENGDMAYGLGLMRLALPCGSEFWGHNGGIPGSITYAGVVPATGRAVTIALNQDFTDKERFPAGSRALTAAACPAP
ncbi:serine hydrolase domain-containing protein [Nocardia goodfellowii]|uniref:D-alanyl-D-alanine carboxypeptidase n=1 Tax=Nocardia goodfellowii TaxID=882446 RepID=A0ABS4QNT9_9NOCA|nr:serine hydrolase domain-containing protein [Nocardia goodfellowii]MBP2193381.1 D-alanyl-D-alanine carboxypeptidase [Nocardia goodfellowii]